jgi:DNA-binding protein H-NS
MGVQQMQAQGQEVPPEYRKMLETPTWEDVIAVLRSDAMRTFRISVETDSTIREMIQQDFAGLSEVLNTLSAVFGAAPQLQQAGASNGPEVTKEIALSVCRQAKMGRAVEDAVENLDFQAGGSQIDQLTQMVQQIGQAVQQGAEQLQQMGQSLEQGTQKLGQHEKILEQLIKIVQTLGPEPPQQQPAMAAVQ